MRSHLRSVAKRKVSDFAAAAFVGATALAMLLFVSQDTPPKWCPGHLCPNEYLCCWNGDPGVGNYTCIADPGPPRPYDCW